MTRLAYIPNRIIDHNGIADGAVVHVYLTGTTTPINLYSDSAMTVPMVNPFTVAAGAAFPAVFYDSSVNIKLTIISALDGSIEEYDPYNPLSVSVSSPFVSVKAFGATGDGVTNDSAAFVNAIAFLKLQALNTGGGGFYKGSQKLFVPAGHYYMGTTTLDINHTLMIEGEGSGLLGAGAFGCTHLRWADATDGIRFQAANTSGNTTIDGSTHDGTGGCVIRGICLEGGFTGTESDHHGIVIRNAIQAQDLNIINWPGEGVKAWAGTIVGGSPVAGNVSTTCLISVKTQNCRGGIDIRGGDANVVTTINCQGYQNRWFGILDDNGAGSNTHISPHCASNGQVSGTWAQTQCSYTSKYYALKWGGDATVAPSGTTADTANWYYIGAGAPVVNLIPAWVNTPGTFRAGGDYMTINTAGVTFIQPYSETGPFSQFNPYTQILNGTLLSQYYRGGHQILSNGVDGAAIKVWGNNHLDLLFSGAETGLTARNLADGTLLGYLHFVRGDRWWVDSGLNIHSGGLQMAETTVIDTSRNATLAATTTTTLGATTITATSLAATGAVTGASAAVTGALTSSSPTAGIGYATGAGGTVTQATSRTTGVTLNKMSGAITLFSAAGSATYATMTVTNSSVAATDTVRVCQASGTDKYMTHVTHVGAGTFDITFATTGGTTTEQPVFNFSVIKGVTS